MELVLPMRYDLLYFYLKYLRLVITLRGVFPAYNVKPTTFNENEFQQTKHLLKQFKIFKSAFERSDTCIFER